MRSDKSASMMLLFIHPLLQSKQWLLISRRFSLFVQTANVSFSSIYHMTCIHFSLPSVVSVILLSTCITTLSVSLSFITQTQLSAVISLSIYPAEPRDHALNSEPRVCLQSRSSSLKVLNAALSGHRVQS